MNYDRIISKTVDYEKMQYGILFGNEKVVFIKVGADREIRGYQDKYLRMAHRVHERIGATVICATNPYIDRGAHLEADRNLIDKVIAEGGLENCKMHFVGTSDGGYHSLLLAKQFPQATKYLGINSSHCGIEDFAEKILGFSEVKKILVYGTEDDDFNTDVPALRALACDSLEIILVDGADHRFSGRVDEFIALIDLI